MILKAIQSVKMLGTSYQTVWHNIIEYLYLEEHHCQYIKSHRTKWLFLCILPVI
jgi:hypothetical protein